MDFWKDFQTNWIHTLEPIRWQCWGGCAPQEPLLRGAHLEERTVAGTPLCGARDTFSLGENHLFHNSWGRSWKKNRLQINVKTKSRWGRPPRLHFVWLWVDLGSQVGSKLGGKIEPRQAKTGQDKGRQGKRREGKAKEEEGKGLEGKGVEKCGLGDFPLGGGRGSPDL